MILHVPHSSSTIPEELRDQIVLSDEELRMEQCLMTDAFTDELFALPETTMVRFPISRLLVDVERFPDNATEPMSKVGMGMMYTRTAFGKQLRRTLQADEKRNLLTRYYETHHHRLAAEVEEELEQYGKALIVDCHSFASQPLPFEMDQAIPRPEFCIGTDSFHTPGSLTHIAARCIKGMGFTVDINRPYAGSLVPMAYYRKDRLVASIMIEVNRSLYMDELSGIKAHGFDHTKEQIQGILKAIREFQQQAQPNAWGEAKMLVASLGPRAG
jgi:N-formylglutamate amidohydrolase